MTATHSLDPLPRFPVDGTVTLHGDAAFPGGQSQPIGAVLDSTVTAADGRTTFTGLEYDRNYWAYSPATGQRVRFHTSPDPGTPRELDDVSAQVEALSGAGGRAPFIVGMNNISGYGAGVQRIWRNAGIEFERPTARLYTDAPALFLADVKRSIEGGFQPLICVNTPDATALAGITAATYAANAVAIMQAVLAVYPKVTLWECINEPWLKGVPATQCDPVKYGAIYKATRDAMTAAGGLVAQCKLIYSSTGDVQPLGAAFSAPNNTNGTGGWLGLACTGNAGLAVAIDGISFHPYGPLEGNGTAPSTHASGWSSVAALFRQFSSLGLNVPVYITEVGRQAPKTDPEALVQQQAHLLRVLNDIRDQYTYVQGLWWFHQVDTSALDQDAWGLLAQPDFSAKPAFATLLAWLKRNRTVVASRP